LSKKKGGDCDDEKLRVRFCLFENLIDNFISQKESIVISAGEFVINY
jgi:hypothetical protein